MLLATAIIGTAPAVEGATAPRSADGCTANAKARKSTEAMPFTVRLRVRCAINVRRISITTNKKLTRVKRAATVNPATDENFTCEREKPKKIACSGESGPPDSLITIMFRVEPGPCKKPRLDLDILTRGTFYCDENLPGVPCIDDPRGGEVSTSVAGC